MKNEGGDDTSSSSSKIQKKDDNDGDDSVSGMVEKKWNNFLESLGNCLGGRSAPANRAIERGNSLTNNSLTLSLSLSDTYIHTHTHTCVFCR